MDIIESAESDLSPQAFARFARFITAELGIKMPDSKLTMVQSRLLRRVRELRLNSIEQYGEYFFESAHIEEREHFINAITTNKTDFFREPGHFDFLTRVAVPSLRPSRPGPRFKLWSAGCSSGEEVWSLAMILSRYASQRAGFEFAILGTDVSTKVLDSARSGIYPEPLVRPVPPDLRRRYLLRSRHGEEPLVRVVPELRQKASFFSLNLMDEDYHIGDMFDVVFFRNVLIYFDKPTQEEVINKICRHLSPGGYLFVGHSESLAGLDTPLNAVHNAVFRKAGD
jgi:chemotaxis protein methyltransferase CheR